MRYESIPRKITNAIGAGYKALKREFGVWSYLIIAFAVLLLYKPVVKYFDIISTGILYIFLGGAIIFILYYFIRKFFRWAIAGITLFTFL